MGKEARGRGVLVRGGHSVAFLDRWVSGRERKEERREERRVVFLPVGSDWVLARRIETGENRSLLTSWQQLDSNGKLMGDKQ